jgi:hypothetical protein
LKLQEHEINLEKVKFLHDKTEIGKCIFKINTPFCQVIHLRCFDYRVSSNTQSVPTLIVGKYKNNIFNGLPALLFDGANDFMLANSVGISGKGLTIFLTARRNAYTSPSGIMSGLPIGEANDFNPGCFQTFYDQNSAQYFTVSTNTWFSVVSQPSPPDNTPFISSTIFNGSFNISYLNTFVGSTVNGSPTFRVDRLYVGSRFTGNTVNSYFNGYIAEIIIFNRGLNAEERLAVTNYLSKKYNIRAS